MKQLAVFPCQQCGAPLKVAEAVQGQVVCQYCRATNTLPEPRDPAKDRFGITVLIGLLGSLGLLIAGSFVLDYFLTRSNADHIVDITHNLKSPYTSSAALAPDGTLWLFCKHNRVCNIGKQSEMLGGFEIPYDFKAGPYNQASPEEQFRMGRASAVVYHSSNQISLLHRGEIHVHNISSKKLSKLQLPLAEGEFPLCVAGEAAGDLWFITSQHDLVHIGPDRALKARWEKPLLKQNPRHHGCQALNISPKQELLIIPESGSAIYILSKAGQLLKQHDNHQSNSYSAITAMEDGTLIAARGHSELFLLNAQFEARSGPKTRRSNWGEITALTTSGQDLIVVTALGHIAFWRSPQERWP